jgi:hypothetical protein
MLVPEFDIHQSSIGVECRHRQQAALGVAGRESLESAPASRAMMLTALAAGPIQRVLCVLVPPSRGSPPRPNS